MAKAATEGPAAWAIVNDGKRPGLTAGLAALLQKQGIEVQKLDQEIEVKETVAAAAAGGPGGGRGAGGGGRGGAAPAAGEAPARPAEGATEGQARPGGQQRTVKVPAGSYIVRMDQPYSRMADMLLDTQFYSIADPQPYDDTGWTLGPLRNVKTMRVTDAAILKAPMTMLNGPARAAGSVASGAAKFYLVNANAEPSLATLRFRLKDVKFFAAEEAFEAGGAKYAAGTFVIPADGNPSDLKAQLDKAANDLGLMVGGTGDDLKVARHAVGVPRIALVHTWTSTQNEGWFRLGLDEFQIPYAYISDQTIRTTPNLKEKYDVLIFPPVTSNIAALINGVPKRMLADGSDFGGPVPWKNTALTPNLIAPGIDQTDDIRGGLGFEGLVNLKKFIEDGGVFIPISATSSLPIELGMTQGVSITDARNLRARGSVVSASVEDKGSPIAYGYDDTLAVYFNQAPVFRVSLGGGGFGGGGGGGGGGAPGV